MRLLLQMKNMDEDGMVTEAGSILDLDLGFTNDDASQAIHELGCGVMEAISRELRQGKHRTFDVTIQIRDEENDEPNAYVIEESASYRVLARSAEEAEAIWLDKGTEAADFLGVNDRDIYRA